jgi:hypothetical protein
MEGLVRESTDNNWITHGQSAGNPMEGTNGSTLVNAFLATLGIFSSVFDWNLIMISSD